MSHSLTHAHMHTPHTKPFPLPASTLLETWKLFFCTYYYQLTEGSTNPTPQENSRQGKWAAAGSVIKQYPPFTQRRHAEQCIRTMHVGESGVIFVFTMKD